ncbi:PQQ-dependent sugar dehydrogenase [Prosthecomicrobium pneumaticum]|uniref:Glucose/arabinose dehydrogenase n=1 Tax=Prosthecomicrobium pneumaticum TaxID=81895 RepID=A0A7W9FQR2_9HYPH|nr:sorbosone dehydrogenase family protein [Prosthecomicrobium pneumaticum]MBB5755143.1 glucose/arabinose dehydrogenase [Prosthecomicrobium pneumaticum]
MAEFRFRRIALLAAGAVLLVGLAGCSDEGTDFDITQQIGPDPVLPEPHQPILADMKVAEVIGWQEGETPAVPEGLAVTAYARDLANPRALHTLPNGDVLVVQSRGPEGEPVSRPKDVIRGWIMAISHGSGAGPSKESNLVTLLRDTNRDGRVDARYDLLEGLASPFGLAFADDTLYVATTEAILVYPYRLGETAITAAPRVLTPLPGGPINHHWTKDLALGPDGRFLYVSVGSNSNAMENGLEAEKGRAAIWEVDRQTGASRVFASGLRNPNGLTFHPDTGVLWAVINERDELGPDLVPDYMTSVKDGAFYGWPWSYYGQHVDPRVRPQRPDLVERAIPPDYALSSHVAPLGMTFTMGSALPEAYRNGAFVGEHGSWNRTFFNGYKVVYVPFENGMPSGKAQDVVTGFLDGERARGRPVGVGIDGTGALLVADDAGNTVWRVAAADGSVTPEPLGTDMSVASPGSDTAPAATAPAAETPGAASGGPSPEQGGVAPPEGGPAAPSTAPGTVAPDTAAPAPVPPATGAPAAPEAPPADEGAAAPSPSPDEQLTGQEPAAPAGSAATPTPSQTEIAPATVPPAPATTP